LFYNETEEIDERLKQNAVNTTTGKRFILREGGTNTFQEQSKRGRKIRGKKPEKRKWGRKEKEGDGGKKVSSTATERKKIGPQKNKAPLREKPKDEGGANQRKKGQVNERDPDCLQLRAVTPGTKKKPEKINTISRLTGTVDEPSMG